MGCPVQWRISDPHSAYILAESAPKPLLECTMVVVHQARLARRRMFFLSHSRPEAESLARDNTRPAQGCFLSPTNNSNTHQLAARMNGKNSASGDKVMASLGGGTPSK
ncbi:unnamed protein product [Scytosiphon promiscuus]